MASTLFHDHGLNVEYISGFIDTKEADAYFSQLKLLPFYQQTLKIRGKSVKPKRLALAYGDPGLSYAYSGTEIFGEEWSPLIIELRDLVEKYAGCSFNFVLLNFYADGSSYISQHKDNEPGLDVTFPIVALSFGAERVLDFMKPQAPTISIKLEHGSLYCMARPTNKLFTHGIAVDNSVKSPRISLTFRHLLPSSVPSCMPTSVSTSVSPPTKKPRLDPCVSDSEQKFLMHEDINEDSSTDILPKNDWLVNFLQQEDNVDPVLAQWSLNWNTFAQIVLDDKFNLRIHIRVFKERTGGVLRPTRKGVSMTLKTWYNLRGKVPHFNFQSVNDSFICNNQLIVVCLNEEFCIFQQMFPLNSSGFFLKPNVLKLSQDQFLKLSENSLEITESIIKAIFLIQLPKLLQNTPAVCNNHLKKEDAKRFLFNCIVNEIEICTNALFKCFGCEFNSPGQKSHDCLMKPLLDKFLLYRQEVFLNLNLYNIISQLKKECTCYYHDVIYFTGMSVVDIENYISEVFTQKNM